MEIVPSLPSFENFEQAKATKDVMIWGALSTLSVEQALFEWLSTLSARTAMNYKSGLNRLEQEGLIDRFMPLQAFSLVNHDGVIDKIKLLPEMKETTRQSRAALYIGFTRFLSRRFPGIFKKAMPCREGTSKTFYRVHHKVVTKAMNQVQWSKFLKFLAEINFRDCLIAKVTLQGGKRIREVLSLTVDQINWDSCEITFEQSKTRGAKIETVITYPYSLMQTLKTHIGDRKGIVFISKKGNVVTLNQVANTFAKAGKEAEIPFKVTPHVLRASAVTYLKNQGFSDSDIMKVTGHASSEMVNAYDKSSRGDNASKKVNLVQ